MSLQVKHFEKLPTGVKAIHYDLSLNVDSEVLIYQGNVVIHVEVVEATKEITLNAINLELGKVVLNGSKQYSPIETNESSDDETVQFVFPEVIPVGQYQLEIAFTGHINFTLRGFYRSKYTNENGEERYAAVTQFCATDARRCFPCWDEPALKATFDVSLTVPEGLTALSNMPLVEKVEDNTNLIRYKFDRTPVMSTYLLAFVIGEYDYVEDQTADGVIVRVYTPKGKKAQGLFALEAATKILPFYKDYFKVAYPLPKIDLVTVADFSFGAMENWGLVTYRETRLLVDPLNSSAVNKQAVAEVVGHELAHQWFGNLVTMEWWTHLWLNEGYASFVPNLAIDQFFPDYNIWTQFVNNVYVKALQLDSLEYSHPVEVPINNPCELFEIFDAISYNKGASIIRMLHDYIGDDHFRKGMNLYLTRHKYANTVTEDLWQALEEASAKPIGRMMNTWTKQLGYPVITASASTRNAEGGTILKLTQEKFTADGAPPPSDDLQWIIPINVMTPSTKIHTVLESKSVELLVPGSNTKWIKVNPGTIGFYRTKYSTEMLVDLKTAIIEKTLPALDRLGVIDDLFALVKAGHTSTVELLKMLQAYKEETDYNVWSSITNILSELGKLIEYADLTEYFIKYQKTLLSKISAHVNWTASPGENHLDTLRRVLILGRLASVRDENTIREAKKRFSSHVAAQEFIPADLRTICYRAVLSSGGKPDFESLMKLYKESDLHEEKNRIVAAFGMMQDSELLKRVLDFSMSKNVRAQDMPLVMISVASSRLGRSMAWEYFKEHAEAINDRLSTVLLTRLIKVTTQDFASEENAKDLEEFFKKNQFPGTERSIQQAVETIRLNSKWLERDAVGVKEYLKSYQ